jgi:DNA-binding transcriptional regulator YhcF (GntR family)
MQTIDYRNESFEQVRGRVDGLRQTIWNHMMSRGEALTTRQIAAETGIDILTVRPRVTELVQIGFAEVDGLAGREGRYRAISQFMARAKYEQERAKAHESQLQLL